MKRPGSTRPFLGARTVWPVMLLALVCATASAQAPLRRLRPRAPSVKPARSAIPAGFERARIQVKFRDEIDVGLGASGAPIDRAGRALRHPSALALLGEIALAGGAWTRNTGAGESTLDRLRHTAQRNLGREIADLNDFFLLDVPPGCDATSWMDELNRLPEVELAYPMPLPPPLPFEPQPLAPRLPGDLTEAQGYLDPATNGIDAEFVQRLAGGAGALVSLVDLEYSWNLEHLDLPALSVLVPHGLTPLDPFGDTDHGSAVLGVLASLDNSFGTTGGAFGTSIEVAPVFFASGYRLVAALQNALVGLEAGDVLLIEQQMRGPHYDPFGSTQDGLVPVEWDLAMHSSIVTAVGNGIHVIESAGNGAEDLDHPAYDAGHAPFRLENDSGAILVGAGGAPAEFGGVAPDRSRIGFSNYGATLDLQGWGARVATTGYGDAYSAEGEDLLYTARFGGTSSAGAIVAAAAALIESFHEARSGTPLTPAALRAVLVETGSPQLDGFYPASERIGPRPDLRAAVCRFDAGGPLLACPPAVTVDAVSPGGVPASDPAIAAFLSGYSVSDDLDPSPSVVTDAPLFFPLGTTTVTFTAADACGNATACQAAVLVVDRGAPEVSIALDRDTLWPPDHALVEIRVTLEACDACDPAPAYVLQAISSDEPDAGTARDDEPDDIQGAELGTPDTVFHLRAERRGGGDGRTYTITYAVTDASGNRTEHAATVVVPHDRRGS